jgi:hypothetical protein
MPVPSWAATTKMKEQQQTTKSTMALSDYGLNTSPFLLSTTPLLYPSMKRHVEKVPPATRHRGVLTLHTPVPLYDMTSASAHTLVDIISSSRNASPVMMINTITTQGLIRRTDDPSLLDLEVTFFSKKDSSDDGGDDATSSITYTLSIPRNWTPCTFLAMVNRSSIKNKVLSLETIQGTMNSYTTINELHLYHHLEKERMSNLLGLPSAYIDVTGGVLVNSSVV